MAAPAQEQLQEISAQRAEHLAERIDWFSTALDQIITSWNAQIATLVQQAPSQVGPNSYLADLHYLRTQIGAQLATLGYAQLAQKAIDTHSDAERAALEQLAILGIQPNRLAPINPTILRTIREIDLSKLFRASDTTINVLSENIVLNFIAGRSLKDVYAAVENSLGQFKHLTSTYVETSLWFSERYIQWQTLGHAVERWQYFGPLDNKTRPFCREHVGKVYTAAEIDKLDNGFAPPFDDVRMFCGGINCRHLLSPYQGKEQ